MRAAFDLSYAVLAAPVRRLFLLLGLVAGPDVTAEAASELAGIGVDEARQVLHVLADAHLIDQGAPGRYAMHDLIRVYAAERVQADDSDTDGETDGEIGRESALRRLYGYYLSAVDAAAGLLYPGRVRLPIPETDMPVPYPPFESRAQALAWLDDERHNLVAAAVQAADNGHARVAWLLADSLRAYFDLRKHIMEWETVARAGLAAATTQQDARAQLACEVSLAVIHDRRGLPRLAIDHYTRVLALARQTGWLSAQAATLDNRRDCRRPPWTTDDCRRPERR